MVVQDTPSFKVMPSAFASQQAATQKIDRKFDISTFEDNEKKIQTSSKTVNKRAKANLTSAASKSKANTTYNKENHLQLIEKHGQSKKAKGP
jgi:hypothetical protein